MHSLCGPQPLLTLTVLVCKHDEKSWSCVRGPRAQTSAPRPSLPAALDDIDNAGAQECCRSWFELLVCCWQEGVCAWLVWPGGV